MFIASFLSSSWAIAPRYERRGSASSASGSIFGLHPWVDERSTRAPMTPPQSARTLLPMGARPTFASLERARSRQLDVARLLRPLGAGVAVVVIANASHSEPGAALHGRGLGVLAALVLFTGGLAGVVYS